MLKRPVYFAATEDLFRKRALGSIIRWFGAFPEAQGRLRLAALRSIFAYRDRGGLVGLFPEGVRRGTGRTNPCSRGSPSSSGSSHVPVYVCRLEGAYLVYPRWARRWRRIPVRGVFSRLYEPGGVPAETTSGILCDIAAAIRSARLRPWRSPRPRAAGPGSP